MMTLKIVVVHHAGKAFADQITPLPP